ncbi:MAG TPA: ATP-binding protein [Gemmatimonadaceae bacterium]|nr:ATP-binding protein [Gemmatimonadaceae bacterium]
MPEHSGSDTSGPTDPVPTVLIVDDRKENLLALEAVLDPIGIRVVRASSGLEAVARCREEEFAVVVLDVMMPGADGVETARRIKELGASRLTPIIFLTAAESDRRRIHDGYASGAVDYLFKPIDPDVLRAKVAAFVEMYRNRRADHWLQRRRYADQAAAATAAAHREGEQRFRLLAESVPAMVWTASADGRPDSMNAFGARYVGAGTDRVSDVQWTDHVHPDDVATARREWVRSVRTSSPFEVEVRIWSAERSEFRRHIARAAPRRNASGSVLGWVGVNSDVEESKLAEEAAHELQLTAERRARIASDDARVELARALDRIARLQALTAALSEAATPAEVARAVVVHGVAALNASAVVVAMLDRDEHGTAQRLRVVATHGYPQRATDPWREIPIDAELPISQAARLGKPVFVGDPEVRVREFPLLAGVEAVHASAYAMPLTVRGEVIGVLGLSFPTADELSAEDQRFADGIARQCAQALHRAELFAAERRAHQEAETARRRVEFLSEAGAVLNESLDYQQTLQALVEVAVPFLGDYALVDMLGADGTLQRLALMHWDPAKRELLTESVQHIAMSPDAAHPIHGAIVDGTSRLFSPCGHDVIARIARSPRHLELLEALELTSLLVVPLRARDRTRGVMVFGRTTPGPGYSAADLQLAEDLVRRASIAIDTAILYEQAQEANRAKASFLAAISHDLRQPLNASLGFLEIALMGIRGDVSAALREDLERVRRNQQHLLALINDVLSFARVEAGQLLVRRDVVPLREVLDGLPSLVSPQANAKGITLSIRGCPRDVTVLGDRDRVVQIFTNLLTNAIKATPSGGRVSVECEPGGDVVLGHVRDTGVGIPDEMRDRIFEPFVQVARSLNKPEDGIGLGLSISRNLARAMGGDLTVESALGQGSVFTVRLPTAALATPSLSAAAIPG